MTKITFVSHDGTETPVDATDGESVMEAAMKHGVEAILAECGGACACATCHVYVDEGFLAKVGEAGDMERSMLDFAEGVKPNSRLSCQITMSPELEGLRVTTPESQY